MSPSGGFTPHTARLTLCATPIPVRDSLLRQSLDRLTLPVDSVQQWLRDAVLESDGLADVQFVLTPDDITVQAPTPAEPAAPPEDISAQLGEAVAAVLDDQVYDCGLPPVSISLAHAAAGRAYRARYPDDTDPLGFNTARVPSSVHQSLSYSFRRECLSPDDLLERSPWPLEHKEPLSVAIQAMASEDFKSGRWLPYPDRCSRCGRESDRFYPLFPSIEKQIPAACECCATEYYDSLFPSTPPFSSHLSADSERIQAEGTVSTESL